MPISDKNRKILWARSGNLCAICRQKLVIDETEKDDNSIVGEECHIVARSPQEGRRYDAAFPSNQIESLDNLILLCSIHHKMIDDQYQSYSVEKLRQIKQSHESWIEKRLVDVGTVSSIKIRRVQQNIPKQLKAVTSGVDLFKLVLDCHGSYHYHDENLSDPDIELIGGFFQEIQDWGDLSCNFEPIERIRAKKRIDDYMKELKNNGFFVFAATEIQRIEGGIEPPSNWKILHLSVLRTNSTEFRV